MKCHSCKTTMELKRTATSERSSTRWYKCAICHAEHMSTRLTFNDEPDVADIDPFSNFVTSSNKSINANDENNFQLRQMDYH